MGISSPKRPRIIGRYAVYGEIAPHRGDALGGMAVHYGRLIGVGGFTRTVAIKRLHPELAGDPELVRVFFHEARQVSRIRAPNVVPTLDVVAEEGELFLVMDYVPGETLSRLVAPLAARGERVPPRIACGIAAGMLRGLAAAHEAKSSRGEPRRIVHGDVSPQNVLVGTDGVPRLLDFGVAKAGILKESTEPGLGPSMDYMAPELLEGEDPSTRSDTYACGALLWEALTGRRLFAASNKIELVMMIREASVEPPSRFALGIPPQIDSIVLRALARDPAKRWPSAREMAAHLDACLGDGVTTDVAAWVEKTAGAELAKRAEIVREMEQDLSVALADTVPPPAPPWTAPAGIEDSGRPSAPGASSMSTSLGASGVSGVSVLGATGERSERTSMPMSIRARRAQRPKMLGTVVTYAAIGFFLVTSIAMLLLPRVLPDAVSPSAASPPPAASEPPRADAGRRR